MEIGVRIPHTGSQATPEFVRTWCTAADEAGFGSLWGADHMVMPRHVASKYTVTVLLAFTRLWVKSPSDAGVGVAVGVAVGVGVADGAGVGVAVE